MTGREKGIAALLLILFISVGLAVLYEGRLLFIDWMESSHANSSAVQKAGPFFVSGTTHEMPATSTPLMPGLNTPEAATATIIEPGILGDNPKLYADELSLAQAVQKGWTMVTIYSPWGEQMVFSFQPVDVDFQEPDFARVCPFYEQKACISTRDGGVYALTHSEYPGAVAEQARSVVEGSLYSLDIIKSNVAALSGAEAEIQLADGSFLHARVADFTRTTGTWNMFNLAENRAVLSDRFIIEFCGLPHLGDQTDAAGATGSIYVLTLSKGD